MNDEFVEKVETTCQNNSDCRALFGTRDSDPVIDLLGLQQNHMSPKPHGSKISTPFLFRLCGKIPFLAF